MNIRRDAYVITTHSKVCSRHFSPDKMIEPTTPQGRRRLAKDAVPTLFEWNQYTVATPKRGVWDRVDRFVEAAPPEDEVDQRFKDHDYCSVPEPAAMDMSASAAEGVTNEVEELRKELQELRLQRVLDCNGLLAPTQTYDFTPGKSFPFFVLAYVILALSLSDGDMCHAGTIALCYRLINSTVPNYFLIGLCE